MSNMKNIINTHNKKIINPPKDNIARTCNCIRKHQCPLNEKCLTSNILYKQVLLQTKKIQKQKFIMALLTQYSSSYMRTIKNIQ